MKNRIGCVCCSTLMHFNVMTLVFDILVESGRLHDAHPWSTSADAAPSSNVEQRSTISRASGQQRRQAQACTHAAYTVHSHANSHANRAASSDATHAVALRTPAAAADVGLHDLRHLLGHDRILALPGDDVSEQLMRHIVAHTFSQRRDVTYASA